MKRSLPRLSGPDFAHAHRWWVLGVVCTSLMMVMVANTSLNMALPDLSRELGITSSEQQWLIDGYSLIFAGLLFTMSQFAERFGRKRVLHIGVALFVGASAYGGLVASSANELIATRVLMGVSGAMVMPSTLSILTTTFPPQQRAEAVAIWAGVAGAAASIGMLASAFIIEYLSWHGIFLLAVPVGLVAIAAGLFLLPESRDPEARSLDLLGGVLSTTGLVLVVYALIEAPNHGWTSVGTVTELAAGAILLALFVTWERKTASPMLDMALFRSRAFSVSALSMTLVFFALMGIFFAFPQLFQLVMGYDSIGTAIRLAPVALFLMIASAISPRLVRRFGKRRVVAAGLLILATGIIYFTTLNASSSYAQVLFGIAMAAIGIGLAMSPTTDLLMSAVPLHRAGMGSAMNDTTRELGGSLGVAIIGSILASGFASQMSSVAAGLPPNAREAATSSLGAAVVTGSQIGGPQGEALITGARQAWMTGFAESMLVGAVIVALTAALTWFWMPDAAEDVAESSEEPKQVNERSLAPKEPEQVNQRSAEQGSAAGGE